ncbi:MAG: four helix bundle protein [Lewinella sp.]|uniref:four helix bundle protein n=1 Tax=Lewinella sp. TaxID=2004506 RepID=UPI003D6B952A
MNFEQLLAYQKSVIVAMEVFELSKAFPKVETYALTDQIRRSSRSVSAQIAEAYRKRRYPKHFISKLTDADAENAETQVWLEYALRCQYISEEQHQQLLNDTLETGKLIGYMIRFPERFLGRE